MRPLYWHRRLLPITFVLLALLFIDKAAGLAREAAAKDVSSPASAPPGTAAPESVPDVSAGHPQAAGSPMASVTPTELSLLQSLRARRKQLDDREHALDQRTELMQVAEAKLQTRIEQLSQLQTQLQQLEQARRKRSDSNWSGLVKTYEDMKPADAAAIFNVLDMGVSLEVLDRMDERKAAAILSGMLPERARLVTQMLAVKRTHQEALDSPAIVSASR